MYRTIVTLPLKIVSFLVWFNLALALIALIYDWPALVKIPVYFWPFLAICPLYPLFLARFWWKLAQSDQTPPSLILTGLASLPAVCFGLLGLIYYPMLAGELGLTLLDWGQLLWIWLYAAQALLIFLTWPAGRYYQSPFIISFWLLLVFMVQFSTKTLGYLDLSTLSQYQFNLLALVAFSLAIILPLLWWIYWLYRPRKPNLNVR